MGLNSGILLEFNQIHSHFCHPTFNGRVLLDTDPIISKLCS